MKSLILKDWFMITVVSLCVFVFCYSFADKIIGLVKEKSSSKRQEVIHLLDLMFVETNEKKISMLLYLLSFGLGLVFFLLLLPNVLIGLLIGSAIVVAGFNVPPIIVKNMFDRRASLLVDQMVDGLTIMSNGIKSGLSVTQSMERVVENLPNPLSQEFALVLSQIRLGRSVEEALIEFGERIPKADVQMFVTAINILKETGGNLAETFTTIVLTIRERQKIEKKIEAMTAQGVMQGIIISMVPFVLIGVFFVIDPGYIQPMFNSTLGLVMLLAMLVFQIIGGITIRKIVKIQV